MNPMASVHSYKHTGWVFETENQNLGFVLFAFQVDLCDVIIALML